MALMVEQNTAFDPIDIGLFSADTIVFEGDFVKDLIEQLWLVVHILVGIQSRLSDSNRGGLYPEHAYDGLSIHRQVSRHR
jgi:hypothetical protein